MNIIADLQLHSKYSQAVSNKLNIEELCRWAMVKGIGLLATGDWTHPLWIREIKEKLVETGNGTLKLNPNFQFSNSKQFPLSKFENINSHFESLPSHPEFLLATEISSIYSQGGKVRKVHNLLWAPSLSVVDRIVAALLKRGCNLSADGRPIVGLSSIELSELIFEIDETCMIIPAHAWTPWFGMYGSKSGFDSIEECFGKYADRIYAVETGLSSDPAMNWRIAGLDHRAIVSFSDAHSGPKLGREATVFSVGELSYRAIRDAILSKTNKGNHIVCTYEFYPEEGKYHWDGHRNCNHRQTPETTRKNGTTCPVCGRGLTVGVEYRIDQIANRPVVAPVPTTDEYGVRWMHHPDRKKPPYISMVPLLEIISETLKVSTSSKKVLAMYDTIVSSLGDEFTVLLRSTHEEIERVSEKALADAVCKVRAGDIVIDPGYDGVFGTVKVWGSEEKNAVEAKEQLGLF